MQQVTTVHAAEPKVADQLQQTLHKTSVGNKFYDASKIIRHNEYSGIFRQVPAPSLGFCIFLDLLLKFTVHFKNNKNCLN